MKARRNIRPSSRRTGMLCRFGRSELSRPVRATVWLNVAWMRPSGATSAIKPSPYVPRSFSTSRYCSSGPMNSGHSSRSFSSVAASVDAPVFVRFTAVSPRPAGGAAYSSSRSWIGELMFRSSRPTTSFSSVCRRWTSPVSRS